MKIKIKDKTDKEKVEEIKQEETVSINQKQDETKKDSWFKLDPIPRRFESPSGGGPLAEKWLKAWKKFHTERKQKKNAKTNN